jgi:hypothetical protein
MASRNLSSSLLRKDSRQESKAFTAKGANVNRVTNPSEEERGEADGFKRRAAEDTSKRPCCRRPSSKAKRAKLAGTR